MTEAPPFDHLPMLYDRIRPLDRMKDRDLRVLPAHNYAFAATATAIPVVAEEFYTAQGTFPVVFSGKQNPRPVAIVGLLRDENLFVGSDGAWAVDAHLPFYLRRHPFLLIDAADGLWRLGIDANSPRLSEREGAALFEADEPTWLARDMLEFCVRFRRQNEIALALGRALSEHDLLVEYQFKVTASGRSYDVTGCQVAAEDRLAALADDVFLAWRQAGWLPLIHAHLFSLRQWEALGRRSAVRRAQGDRDSAALAA